MGKIGVSSQDRHAATPVRAPFTLIVKAPPTGQLEYQSFSCFSAPSNLAPKTSPHVFTALVTRVRLHQRLSNRLMLFYIIVKKSYEKTKPSLSVALS